MRETSIFFFFFLPPVGLRSSEKVVCGGLLEGTSRPTSHIVHANIVHASFSSSFNAKYVQVKVAAWNKYDKTTVALKLWKLRIFILNLLVKRQPAAVRVESQSQERRFSLVRTRGKVKTSGPFHGYDTYFLVTLTNQLIGIQSKCVLNSRNLMFEHHTKHQPPV